MCARARFDSSPARIDLPAKILKNVSTSSSFSLAAHALSQMIKCRNSYDVLRAREGSCIDRTPAVSRVQASSKAYKTRLYLPIKIILNCVIYLMEFNYRTCEKLSNIILNTSISDITLLYNMNLCM